MLNSEVTLEQPNFKFCLRTDLQQQCGIYNLTHPDLPPLNGGNFLPNQVDPVATGYDVRSASLEAIMLNPGSYLKIPLGFRMFAPKGWWLQLAPRSSTFMKLNIHPLYGIIDENFENEMMFVGQYLPDQSKLYSANQQNAIHFGDRIAQIIPVKRQSMVVSEVTSDEYQDLIFNRQGTRGEGGFGSSGAR